MQKCRCNRISIYIFVTFFFFSSLLCSCSLSKSPIPVDSIPPIVTFSSDEANQTFYNDFYTLRGSVPSISFPQNQDKEKDLNTIIFAFLFEEMSYWTESIKNNILLETIPKKGELWVEYEPIYASLEKISFLFYFSIDLGGAHPEEYSKSLNIDISKGKQLETADLFLSQSSYLPILSKVSRENLIEQFSTEAIEYNDEWLREGTAPKPDNFYNVCISPQGLLVTFNPYQVTSYSNGFQSIQIPYNKLCRVMAFKPNPDATP